MKKSLPIWRSGTKTTLLLSLLNFVSVSHALAFNDAPKVRTTSPVTVYGEKNWRAKSIDDDSTPTPSKFLGASCTGSGTTAVCTAVGYSYDSFGSSIPLLAVSTDGGMTFAVKIISMRHRNLSSVSCTGSGAAAICTAVGSEGDRHRYPGDENLMPYLTVSRDGGTTWGSKAIQADMIHQGFTGTSCTGSGATAICTAVTTIFERSNTERTVVFVSTNGGVSWKNKVVLQDAASIHRTSCTGSGTTAICTAVGSVYRGKEQVPLLLVSTDGGATWKDTIITGAPREGDFLATSCTGSGSTAICTAVGDEYSNGSNDRPLLAVSTDGGMTWAAKTITGSISVDEFSEASCTGSGATAICAAVGYRYSRDNDIPLLAVSTDGGMTFALKTIAGDPKGTFESVSCTGSGTTAICTAVGDDNKNGTGNRPLLAVSTDGGISFAVKAITDNKEQGDFNSVSCTGSGSTAICTAVGGELNNPLLAVSTDGGMTWKTKLIAGASYY